MRTAIMTDTNSGITTEEGKSLGIFVIPMPIIIEDEVYYEGINITEKEFYEALTGGKNLSTSQPSPGEVMDMWDSILESGDYDQVVYIPMSSGLSNSCSAAMGLALEYEDKVFVADNHRISVTMRESVLSAKKLADEGKSGSEIKKALEDDAYNSSIYISVNTLEFLKKGGRITPAAAMIGTMLNIKPILTIQGEKLDSFAKARSMKKCQDKMLEALKSELAGRFSHNDMSQLKVGAAGAGLSEEEIENWLSMVKEAFPDAKVFYGPLSASVACHTGPGAVGIGISF